MEAFKVFGLGFLGSAVGVICFLVSPWHLTTEQKTSEDTPIDSELIIEQHNQNYKK